MPTKLIQIGIPADGNGEIQFLRQGEDGRQYDIRAATCYESWQQWGADKEILGENVEIVEAWRRGQIPGFWPPTEEET